MKKTHMLYTETFGAMFAASMIAGQKFGIELHVVDGDIPLDELDPNESSVALYRCGNRKFKKFKNLVERGRLGVTF